MICQWCYVTYCMSCGTWENSPSKVHARSQAEKQVNTRPASIIEMLPRYCSLIRKLDCWYESCFSRKKTHTFLLVKSTFIGFLGKSCISLLPSFLHNLGKDSCLLRTFLYLFIVNIYTLPFYEIYLFQGFYISYIATNSSLIVVFVKNTLDCCFIVYLDWYLMARPTRVYH